MKKNKFNKTFRKKKINPTVEEINLTALAEHLDDYKENKLDRVVENMKELMVRSRLLTNKYNEWEEETLQLTRIVQDPSFQWESQFEKNKAIQKLKKLRKQYQELEKQYQELEKQVPKSLKTPTQSGKYHFHEINIKKLQELSNQEQEINMTMEKKLQQLENQDQELEEEDQELEQSYEKDVEEFEKEFIELLKLQKNVSKYR